MSYIYIYHIYIYISDIYHIYHIYQGEGEDHHKPPPQATSGGEEERVDKLKGRKDHDHPPGIHIHKVDIQMY